MKLTELNPSWLTYGGNGVTHNGQPVPEQDGVGVLFDCPCGCGTRCPIIFANPIGGGSPVDPKGWQRTGETFETLTLTPSIQRNEPCPKRWHGFITNGGVSTC